jgi:glycosyltransferase involved in cell wall biosynthesis
LPVIVSEECNFRNAETRGAGLEVTCNIYSLYDALMKLLNNSELRVKMGASGKQLVRNNYNWNAVVKRIERAYQNAVNFR